MSKGLEISFLKARNAEKREDYAEAERLYNAILQKFPKNARAHKGVEQLRQARTSAALAADSPPQHELDQFIASYQAGLFTQAVAQGEALASRYPKSLLVQNLLGATYLGLKDARKAESAFKNALSLNPEFPAAFNNLGIALKDQGRLSEASEAYQQAIKLNPNYAEAYNNFGNVLKDQNDLEGAENSYRRAIEIIPDYADALNNLGMTLHKKNELDKAVSVYKRALNIKPYHAEALNNIGNVFLELGNFKDASVAYNNATLANPQHKEAHNNLGLTLVKLGKVSEAIEAHKRALAINPDVASSYFNLGNALYWQGKLDKTIEAYQHALNLDPDDNSALAQKLHQQAHICDWTAFEEFEAVAARLGLENNKVSPFATLLFEDNPERQLKRSQVWAKATYKQRPIPLPVRKKVPGDKLRIGYFSADFHSHATMHLMSGLFREHDRQRFEIYAYSYGSIVSDEIRAQLLNDVDCFVDIRDLSDLAVIELAHNHGLDIAIDLKGYTTHTRSQLFAYRLAPIQINYLGYPGSMGADFIDYIIADASVIPEAERQYYSEKIICLPGSYQANDNKRAIAQAMTTRADFGLPEEAFVFCCFNQSYKISPREFDIWMRLLEKVEDSVLWLLYSNRWAEANLRKEAEKYGIDPARIVFAEKLDHTEHLARLKHADLFLDTFNVNAHTTASDALWAGLPVVTKVGRQFAARVSASLLNAIGLPELVTENEEAYEALILALATTPGKLAKIKARLADNRLTQPLFDTELYTRRIEAAYQAAYQRHIEGQPPAEIVIG